VSNNILAFLNLLKEIMQNKPLIHQIGMERVYSCEIDKTLHKGATPYNSQEKNLNRNHLKINLK